MESAKKHRIPWRWRRYLATCALGLIGMITAAVVSKDRTSIGLFTVGMMLYAMTRSSMRGDMEERERESTKMTESRMLHVMQLRAHLPEKLPDGWTDLYANFQGWHVRVGVDEIAVWTRDDRPEQLRVSLSRADAKSTPDAARILELLAHVRGVGRFEPASPSYRGYLQFEALRVDGTKGAEERRRSISQLN